ncbi:MAG TPA: hypothetical protein DEW46_12590, partial [Verrucomicrobia bacterium]|nr:hypothetical protein [Verrucomicrobiota bacterium]
EIEIGIGIPVRDGTWPSEHRPNRAAELCSHRNKSVALPGFSLPNPIPPPFDTEAGSDPDPELASPSAFSDELCQS